MKKFTCKDLGGPCNTEIMGNSFEEIGKKSHEHVMEQINGGDEAHRIAANKMMSASPAEQKLMMTEFERKYNEAPNI